MKILDKIRFPCCKKHHNNALASVTSYRNCISRLPESSFQLQTTTENKDKIVITPELMTDFHENDDIPDKGCQIALRQALPDKKIILMTDAFFQPAGYAVLVKDTPYQNFKRKFHVPNNI